MRMERENITTGQEVIFNGMVWGIVEEVFEDSMIVIDQDGGDHELGFGQVDAWL
ncbi:hypothetical protein N9955_00615 [bacterium]|nr:hypothetical protein [bacterium]